MNRDRPLAVPVLAALFVASGATGLVYESIWAAYLRLFLGHAAYAQAVVLVVFVGGMALGSLAIGAVSERIRRPLLAYAAVEAAIGVLALGFHPIFVHATAWAYTALLPGVCTADSLCFASFVVAALLILPPAALLGATFPLMTAGVLRLAPARAGERIALFYAVNSFGAVGGVLLAGLVLVPAFGLPGAILTAGLANFAVAIGAYVVDGGVSAPKAPAIPSRAAPPLPPVAGAGRRLLLAVAAITGATSFVYEIIWIRLLSLVLGASTHSFELMLAAFIFGIALGSLWIRRRIDTLPSPLAALGAVQVLMGAFALGTLPLYALSFPALAAYLTMLTPTAGGYGMFMLFGGALSVAIMLPVTVLAGMTLPLLTAMLLRGPLGERSIGWVYGANTVGSIAGVLVGVNLALPLLGAKHGLAAAALADVALGLLLLARAPRRRGTRRLAAGSIAVAAALCAVGLATALDPLVLSSGVYRTGAAQADDGTTLVFHRDGRTATVDVLRSRDGVLALRTNGKTDASLTAEDARKPEVSGDEATQVLLAALPLLHRPDARNVAVVGFGSGMTSAMLLEAPGVREVVTVEIEPAMVEGARAFLPRTARAYDDPRSRIVLDDAKSYFARAARRFDVIVSEPSNPWVSGTSSLFTAEFYAHVARTLTPGGVFAQWIHTYEFDSALLASVLKALQSQFDDYVIYETDAGDLVIVATVDGRVPEPRRDVLDFGAMGAALRAVGVGSVDDFSRLAVARGTTADFLIARAPLRSTRTTFRSSTSTPRGPGSCAPARRNPLVAACAGAAARPGRAEPAAQDAVDAATGSGADRGAGARGLRGAGGGVRGRTALPRAARRPARQRRGSCGARRGLRRLRAAGYRRRVVGPHRGARGGDHPAAAGAGGGSDVAAAGRRCVRHPAAGARAPMARPVRRHRRARRAGDAPRRRATAGRRRQHAGSMAVRDRRGRRRRHGDEGWRRGRPAAARLRAASAAAGAADRVVRPAERRFGPAGARGAALTDRAANPAPCSRTRPPPARSPRSSPPPRTAPAPPAR